MPVLHVLIPKKGCVVSGATENLHACLIIIKRRVIEKGIEHSLSYQKKWKFGSHD
jgi:hypothetical protein